MEKQDRLADGIIAVIAPSLRDRLLVVLPDREDIRVRIVQQSREARIWEDYHKENEIVSLGAVIARGEQAALTRHWSGQSGS